MSHTTRASLLSRVCKGDEVSWEEFYKSYINLFHGINQQIFHFNDHDIKDVIQEVMLCFFEKSTTFKYDRTQGRISNYLGQTFRNKAKQFRDRRMRKKTEIATPIEDIEQLSGSSDEDFYKIWNAEWQKLVINQSLHDLKETIEPQTFQIFHHLVIEEIPPEEVADAFQTTLNNVRSIKSRLAKKVRAHAQEYMDECVNF